MCQQSCVSKGSRRCRPQENFYVSIGSPFVLSISIRKSKFATRNTPLTVELSLYIFEDKLEDAQSPNPPPWNAGYTRPIVYCFLILPPCCRGHADSDPCGWDVCILVLVGEFEIFSTNFTKDFLIKKLFVLSVTLLRVTNYITNIRFWCKDSFLAAKCVKY